MPGSPPILVSDSETDSGEAGFVCADANDIFVDDGNGAVRGLTPLEHVQWACRQEHQMQGMSYEPDANLAAAVAWELESTAGEIDDFREGVMAEWVEKATELEYLRDCYVAKCPEANRALATKLHLPFIEWLAVTSGYPDVRFLSDLMEGFPYCGDLPECCVGVGKDEPKTPESSIEELFKRKDEYNALVLGALKETEHARDLMAAAVEDAEEGYMTFPVPLDPRKLDEIHVSRRIAVREWRYKHGEWYQRTRAVDHKTESGINPSTQAKDRPKHETLDCFVWMALQYHEAEVKCDLWKRDLRKAFRGCPIKADHHSLAFVVWLLDGLIWASGHKGMPFGTTSAVYAFHRLGEFLSWVCRKLARAPVGRYVDDFFGVARLGVVWTGGVILGILTDLFGRPVDHDKSVDHVTVMTLLGAEVMVDCEAKTVSSKVDKTKAEHWKVSLEECLSTKVMDPGVASKLAGRLSFAVTVAADRCGRAYIGAFHAQAHSPLAGHRLSAALEMSTCWFLAYLDVLPTTVKRPGSKRQVVRMWTDAATCPSWVAAVVEIDGQFWYTRQEAKQWLFDQLNYREDNYVGILECAAVILGVWSFKKYLKDKALTLYTDNQGVLGALLKGSSHCQEQNIMVGQFWLMIAQWGTAAEIFRVESAANVADGPTRNDLNVLRSVGAAWQEPSWPVWVSRLWEAPVAAGLPRRSFL